MDSLILTCFKYFSYFWCRVKIRCLGIICFLILMNQCPATCFPEFSDKADSTKAKLNAECTISFNTNGIASIPAFSLGKPALIASAGLAKGRISFDPVLAYGLDMHPWFIDSWIHLRIIDKPSFRLRSGINFSNFFTEYMPPEGVVLPFKLLPAQRYWAFEIAAAYFFTPTGNLTLMYWNDRGRDPETLIGHYISLVGEKSALRFGRNLLFSVNIQLFYIDYTGNNDGLFISPKLSSTLRNFPLSLFFQANQAITTNISPFPGFHWNIGLAYTM